MARRARLTAAEGRRFGLTVGIAFLVITGILLWREHATPARVTGAVGGLLVLSGLLVPTRLGPVERAWMGFAALLSKVTTPIVMTLVYYLAIAPTGLVMRALGRNPLEHEGEEGGFWVARPEGERRGDLTRKF